MSSFKNLFAKVRFTERRGDERAPVQELDATWGTASEQKHIQIRDISSTGIYLLTDAPWQPGTSVELTLHGHSRFGENSRLQVHLWARAVRLGEDGVGLEFEQEPEDGEAWSNTVAKAAELTGKDDPVRLFRTTKELAFLQHVSPEAEGRILVLLSGRMSREAAERAVEIVLKAEELLVARKCEIRTNVSPTLVLQILEDGPKPDEEETRQLWAELLATSCMAGTDDAENMNMVVLLSEMDALELRVFMAACSKAMQCGWKPGLVFYQDLHVSVDEIKRISHLQDLVSIERVMNHLYGMGMVEQTARPLVCAPIEEVNLTPTLLGLKLYIRCIGQTELPETLERTQLENAS